MWHWASDDVRNTYILPSSLQIPDAPALLTHSGFRKRRFSSPNRAHAGRLQTPHSPRNRPSRCFPPSCSLSIDPIKPSHRPPVKFAPFIHRPASSSPALLIYTSFPSISGAAFSVHFPLPLEPSLSDDTTTVTHGTGSGTHHPRQALLQPAALPLPTDQPPSCFAPPPSHKVPQRRQIGRLLPPCPARLPLLPLGRFHFLPLVNACYHLGRRFLGGTGDEIVTRRKAHVHV